VRLLIATMRDLLVGEPAYEARSPWNPVLAIVVALAILAVAALVATTLLNTLGFVQGRIRMTRPAPLPDYSAVWGMATWLIGMQATVIPLVIAAAGFFGGRRSEVLSLTGPVRPRTIVAAILLMFIVQAVYNAMVLPFSHETVMEDVKPFMEPLNSDAVWLFALAIVIGAPLSEELLFRGFLQSALAQTRLGFFGAALVTTMGWTLLHAGYSGLGLVEVFVAGLFFSLLLWRTGNLWVPIIAHAFYNGVVMVALLAVSRA
jgi:membrane protease YdiL (CAAX protease family)